MKTMDNKLENDSWNPAQYQKFAHERTLPFHDLVKQIVVTEKMNVVDLGCGTGELTKVLHDTLRAKHTLGIDSSVSMLKQSAKYQAANLAFRVEGIETFQPAEKFDLIFSNAALQWVPNHEALLRRLSGFLQMNGQIAIQMPANFDYPTHLIARKIAQEAPFAAILEDERATFLIEMEEYATLLYQLGFKKQTVKMQVYPHLLESTDSIVEWVKGSLLTFYQSRLSPELFEEFLARYQDRIKHHFGEVKPFFMPFKRLLIWAQR